MFLISPAYAETAAATPPAGAAWIQLVMMAGLFLIFYFLLIRPQNKQRREHRALIENLTKGDEVVLGGGLLGRITQVDDQYANLEIAQNVEVRVQKSAVISALPKGTLKSIQTKK
ncbi:MAG: preprotein translocase subunit YajC [Pseudomonadota bacterium]